MKINFRLERQENTKICSRNWGFIQQIDVLKHKSFVCEANLVNIKQNKFIYPPILETPIHSLSGQNISYLNLHAAKWLQKYAFMALLQTKKHIFDDIFASEKAKQVII